MVMVLLRKNINMKKETYIYTPLPENSLEDADYDIKEILYEYQEKINKKLAEIQDDFIKKTLKFLGFKKEINEKNMDFLSIFMEENNIKIYCYMNGYVIKKNNKTISTLQPKCYDGEIEFIEEFFEENL